MILQSPKTLYFTIIMNHINDHDMIIVKLLNYKFIIYE
jgi:hypothetical protein